MQNLDMWEWLVVIVLAAAVAWRFWPKSWSVIPRVRFSVRWLMVAVLVVGQICGGFARWSVRRARRQALIARLHVQQQVTNSVIHQARADIAAAGRKNVSFLTRNSFTVDTWAERLDAYENSDGRKMPLIFVEVSGGCDDDLVRPIAIKASGASLEGPLLDRLIHAYRTRGWRHEVIHLPAADK